MLNMDIAPLTILRLHAHHMHVLLEGTLTVTRMLTSIFSLQLLAEIYCYIENLILFEVLDKPPIVRLSAINTHLSTRYLAIISNVF